MWVWLIAVVHKLPLTIQDLLFSAVKSYSYSRGEFGTGTGPFLLDCPFCSGDEPSLISCPREFEIGVHGFCQRDDDIVVKCKGEDKYNYDYASYCALGQNTIIRWDESCTFNFPAEDGQHFLRCIKCCPILRRKCADSSHFLHAGIQNFNFGPVVMIAHYFCFFHQSMVVTMVTSGCWVD